MNDLRRLMYLASPFFCLLYFSTTILAESKSKNDSPISSTLVYMATEDIMTGVRLKSEMFHKQPFPTDHLPTGVVKDLSSIEGAYARSSIAPGEVLTENDIANLEPSSVIAGSVPPLFRAVTIPVSVSPGVDRWMVRGAFVDVVWRRTSKQKPIAKVIAQHAKILAVDFAGDLKTQKTSFASVTLVVSQYDSVELQLAQTTGSLTLSLRNDDDLDERNTRSRVSGRELLYSKETNPTHIGSGRAVIIFDETKHYVTHDGKLIPLKKSE